MKIVVVGAGIGGSALALSLQKAGLDYVLLEQAPAFEEVGAGLQLSPNGVRILGWLGLGDDLARFCTAPDSHKFNAWDSGEEVLRTALGPTVEDLFGAPYYHAFRPDLLDALTRSLDPTRLRLNTQVRAVGQLDGGVWAECTDGQRVEGDVLIGADGIHSVVREQIFKPDPPRRSGYVCWRGVVDADRVAHLRIPTSAYVVMGPRLSFVFYFVSGGRRLNWVALGQADDQMRESWSQTASTADVLASFDGWYDVPRGVIEATETMFVTALHDREPLAGWVDGRIAVMGDAAHAMLPYHAQGAVQSIEDAWVLARSLELKADDPLAALKHFEALRYDRANRIVQHSRNAEAWYHIEDPTEVAARNARFQRHDKGQGENITPQQAWLYSYDAEKAALGTDDDWRALPNW